jgi:hypothetical protein
MGEHQSAAFQGAVEAASGTQGVSVVVARGFVSFRVCASILEHAGRALDGDPDVRAIVIDVANIVGFEPGVPVKIIQWLATRSSRLVAAVVVSPRPVFHALARAAEVMVTDLTCVTAPTRPAALALASQLIAAGRPRVNTGIRRRATGPGVGSKGDA